MQKNYDVVVSGSGMVGGLLACLLAQQGLQVAVIEPKPITLLDIMKQQTSASTADLADVQRVSAISPFSQHLLSQVEAWQQLSDDQYQAYEAMQVWDRTGMGAISFSAAELGVAEMGYIIENRYIQAALWQCLTDHANVTLFSQVSLESYQQQDDRCEIHLSDGQVLQAALLVGADGAQSKVRQLAGIEYSQQAYHQKGVVATVKTSQSHDNTCWQCFLPSGPLAFLPLPQGYSSIVWTLPSGEAERILALPELEFKQQLADALEYRLGDVLEISKRAAFPLYSAHAKQYQAQRVALVGDSAHSIHPLAGQGVNLGMKDAASLAEQIAQGKNIGSYKVLRRYEMARKGDNIATQKAMNAFNDLFKTHNPLLSGLRNTGLMMTNNLPFIKQLLAKQAMGINHEPS